MRNGARAVVDPHPAGHELAAAAAVVEPDLERAVVSGVGLDRADELLHVRAGAVAAVGEAARRKKHGAQAAPPPPPDAADAPESMTGSVR
jgi:hypothetical protein